MASLLGRQTTPDIATSTPASGEVSKDERMRSVVYHGTKTVAVDEMPKPLISDPRDAIIRVTHTAICGSDLHLYHSKITGMKKVIL
jgi:D-arabinose 1-dehydrogenase-like Zn-dependent alcohol dehydrogenase